MCFSLKLNFHQKKNLNYTSGKDTMIVIIEQKSSILKNT